jgi:hypothetical protein
VIRAGIVAEMPATFGTVANELIEVKAEGWNAYIERKISHRWPPVFRDWFDDDYSLDWHWRFFEYVFPHLEDPRELAALSNPRWSQAERAALNRYRSHARDLAGSTLISAKDGYSVRMETLDSAPEITETKSPQDSTVGFLTMLRQCYSPDESASFKRVYDLLGREMNRQGRDQAPLRGWRGTHGQLRALRLDHLILVQAARDKIVPGHLAEDNASHPSHADSPEQMLSAIFYGDSIHWGTKRSVLERWDNEHPAIAVRRRFDSLRAAVQLGHFYVGFAGAVAMLSGAMDSDEL